MTASQPSPGSGNESGGTVPETAAFSNWARRELSGRLRVRRGYISEAVEPVAQAVEDGEPITDEQARDVRRELRETDRLLRAARLASPAETDPHRVAGRVETSAETLEHVSALLNDLAASLREGEEVTEADVECAREDIADVLEVLDAVEAVSRF